MKAKESPITLTVTSPASATTVADPLTFKGEMLRKADFLEVEATLTAPAVGGLTVTLQRRISSVAPGAWQDWAAFAAITAATVSNQTFAVTGNGTGLVTTVGGGTDAAPAPLLAPGTITNIMPGEEIRIVMTGGAGTVAGAPQTISIVPYTERH